MIDVRTSTELNMSPSEYKVIYHIYDQRRLTSACTSDADLSQRGLLIKCIRSIYSSATSASAA